MSASSPLDFRAQATIAARNAGACQQMADMAKTAAQATTYGDLAMAWRRVETAYLKAVGK